MDNCKTFIFNSYITSSSMFYKLNDNKHHFVWFWLISDHYLYSDKMVYRYMSCKNVGYRYYEETRIPTAAYVCSENLRKYPKIWRQTVFLMWRLVIPRHQAYWYWKAEDRITWTFPLRSEYRCQLGVFDFWPFPFLSPTAVATLSVTIDACPGATWRACSDL